MQYAASPILRALHNASANSNRGANSTSSQLLSSILIGEAHNPSMSSNMQSPAALPTEIIPKPRKRSLQNVVTHADRIQVVSWMIETSQQDGEKHIPSRAVRHFPMLFRGNEKANNAKAVRLWAAREEILGYQRRPDNLDIPISLTRMIRAGFKRVYIKARSGRGRKRATWVSTLHDDLLHDFERLRKTGMKINATLWRQLALHLIGQSSNDI